MKTILIIMDIIAATLSLIVIIGILKRWKQK